MRETGSYLLGDMEYSIGGYEPTGGYSDGGSPVGSDVAAEGGGFDWGGYLSSAGFAGAVQSTASIFNTIVEEATGSAKAKWRALAKQAEAQIAQANAKMMGYGYVQPAREAAVPSWVWLAGAVGLGVVLLGRK